VGSGYFRAIVLLWLSLLHVLVEEKEKRALPLPKSPHASTACGAPRNRTGSKVEICERANGGNLLGGAEWEKILRAFYGVLQAAEQLLQIFGALDEINFRRVYD
jgi:hypothetical protein